MFNISIFKYEKLHNILCLILICLLPLSLLSGSLIINLFCILITVIFLFESFKTKNFIFLKSKDFLILSLFWFFLILNTLLSTNFENSVGRGLGFFRFIILIFALRYYFTIENNKYLKFIFNVWLLIFLVVTFDLLFESIFGFNTFGFETVFEGRLSGFLKDELKIGGYYYGFIIICSSFIYLNFKKYFYISFFIFLLTALLIGERANFLKILIMSVPFIFLLKYKSDIKIKYFVLLLIFSFTFILIFKPFYKERYFLSFIEDKKNLNLKNIISKSEKHYAHYSVAYKIFKDNFWFGTGLKNFRIESGNKKYDYTDFGDLLTTNEKKHLRWSTHPHQIHLEFLSETGIIGYTVFCLFFIFSIFVGLKNYYYFQNLYSISGTLFIITTFLPLIPSGSFFTTFGATIFWINYSLIGLKKV
tara:strand:+ start:291 stop:1544 length:1254 start_codon:yes stop_codon:yes gene_type:complete